MSTKFASKVWKCSLDGMDEQKRSLWSHLDALEQGWVACGRKTRHCVMKSVYVCAKVGANDRVHRALGRCNLLPKMYICILGSQRPSAPCTRVLAAAAPNAILHFSGQRAGRQGTGTLVLSAQHVFAWENKTCEGMEGAYVIDSLHICELKFMNPLYALMWHIDARLR